MKRKLYQPAKHGWFHKKRFQKLEKALTDAFPSHETSQAHREATMRIVEAPTATYGKIDTSMSEAFSYEPAQNRKMLTRILANVRSPGDLNLLV